MMIDTHAHLDDEQFAKILDDVLQRAIASGVTNIVTVGTTLASSMQSIQLAERFDMVVAAVGIQPNYCAQAATTDWDAIVTLAGHDRVVALGETGLDRYWDFTAIDVQQDYFDRHLRLAQQMDLPVVVHMRDCEDDIIRMLQQARRRGPLRGVMHSFTGTAATARCCLDMGMHISFAGMVTYKKSHALRDIAGEIPDNRILIETDAPYLSPHPRRGHRPNEPALITHTAACLAEVRGIDLATFVRQTSENARQLFRLPAVD
ncbi:MAG: TatD family deoxyribonuclease [Planctomycetaceae bacterium]|nr:MAG: TatD family deoxyribonuclease [Planctomycetaceae bacterium]